MEALRAGDPAELGRYRLVGRLGSGGMGSVFLGRSPGGRLVAVKVIRGELADSPEFRARFAREIDAARKVSGIFTSPVVDADPEGPRPWLVTGYVQGPSLAQAVAEHGPLPEDSALVLAAGLAEGLGAIHDAGIVHRDLKPSNVLLAADGPRIIDFGIAKAANVAAVTHTGVLVGSPGFMSPEQANGREASPASDVFSLGALLVFATTGADPFGAGTPPTLLHRVVHDPPDLGAVPARLRPLIARCLAKDARRRPSTDQLLAELAASQPAIGWLPWQDGRPWLPWQDGLSAGLAGLAGLAGQTGQTGQTGPDPGPPVAATARPPGPARAVHPARPAGPRRDTSGRPGPPRDTSGRPGPPRDKSRRPGPRQDTSGRPASRQDTSGRPASRQDRPGPGLRRPGIRWPDLHWPDRPWRWAAVAAAVVLIAGAAVAALVTRHAAARHPGPDAPVAARPRAVVEAYFAAINRHDWPQVWRLGGKNLGQTYSGMIAGYRLTRRDVVRSIAAHGGSVSARILAYETTGGVQTYSFRFTVRTGTITSGQQKLLATRHG